MRETEELGGFQKAALDFSFLEHAPDIDGNHHRPIHESVGFTHQVAVCKWEWDFSFCVLVFNDCLRAKRA